MIKICSLDFINKERFDVDIKTADGRILCSNGDKITPDLLLRLYYKEIFIESWPVKDVEDVEEIKDINLGVELTSDTSNTEFEEDAESLKKAEARVAELFEEIEELSVEADEKLEFNEEQAKRVCDYSLGIAKLLNFSENRLKELEQASYYHNIGRSRLSKSDLAQKGFRRKQANESYDILLNEKKLSKSVAEASKLYLDNYNPIAFSLGEEIPYGHIIAIASYYDVLHSQNVSKDEVLKKMLQLGGNKFNIYVLHKFIKMMRETNE